MELSIDVGKIINIDVATATCGGKKNTKIIVGTINEPPPTPKIPDKKPTVKEIRMPITGLKPYSKVFPNVITKGADNPLIFPVGNGL